jgi:hypothetical protein
VTGTGTQGNQGPQGPGGSLTGVTQVSNQSGTIQDGNPVNVSASCPAGKAALGGGYSVTAGTVTSITNLGPTSATTWNITGSKSSGNGKVTVTVICG